MSRVVGQYQRSVQYQLRKMIIVACFRQVGRHLACQFNSIVVCAIREHSIRLNLKEKRPCILDNAMGLMVQ